MIYSELVGEVGEELAEVIVAAAFGLALLEVFADVLERVGLPESAGALRLMLPDLAAA